MIKSDHAITIVIMSIFSCVLLLVSSPAGAEPIADQSSYLDQERFIDVARPDDDFSSIAKEIIDGFGYTFRVVGFGMTVNPSDSPVNPDNMLQIPDYTLELELRPDFFLDFRALNLIAKPRLKLQWLHWGEGLRSGDSNTEDDWFVNEWLVRLRLVEGLFASYGRENLQWGPSWLMSPSNPFFRDNGQSNPKEEVHGMDFGRLVWVAAPSWTVSFIANTGEGLQEFPGGFERAYALKIDYTSFKKYFSAIISHREGERVRFGTFAGWTISDAILLYGEGTLFKRGDYLNPIEDMFRRVDMPVDWIKNDDDSVEGILLLGGSYTFESGPTLTLEYVYNSPGYSDDQTEHFFELADKAFEAYYIYNTDLNLSKYCLEDLPGFNLRLLRKNYIMLQYYYFQIRNVLNLIFRYTYNIDDNSSRFLPIIEYSMGDHSQLFLIGNLNFGPHESEFRILSDRSVLLGIEYTF